MTRRELEARLAALEEREAERARRTEAARAARLAKRRAERARVARQVRMAATDEFGAAKSQRAIVAQMREHKWPISRNTVAAILRSVHGSQLQTGAGRRVASNP